MKSFKKILITALLMNIMMIGISIKCVANSGNETGTGIGFDEPTTDTPLDGGVSLLLAAGVAYGIKKARDKKKSNAESADSLEK